MIGGVTAHLPLHLRNRPWGWKASHDWADETLRRTVMTFLVALVESHSWVVGYYVRERYVDNALNVQPRVGPRNYSPRPDPTGFRLRPGDRILVIGVTRGADRRNFEVGLTFPHGTATSKGEVIKKLEQGREALQAEHRRYPIER